MYDVEEHILVALYNRRLSTGGFQPAVVNRGEALWPLGGSTSMRMSMRMSIKPLDLEQSVHGISISMRDPHTNSNTNTNTNTNTTVHRISISMRISVSISISMLVLV